MSMYKYITMQLHKTKSLELEELRKKIKYYQEICICMFYTTFRTSLNMLSTSEEMRSKKLAQIIERTKV